MRLYLDEARQLPVTDPQGREVIISCGAALHHLLVALSSIGWSSQVHRLPDPAQPACLAEVALTSRSPSRGDAAALAEAIPRRCTDRRRFTSWPVPVELIGELREMSSEYGMTLHSITDPDMRWRVYRAIAEAAKQQAANPAHAAELAAWSGRDPDSLDGVPTTSVPPPGRIPGQPPMREFARPELPQPPTHGEPETAAILLLLQPIPHCNGYASASSPAPFCSRPPATDSQAVRPPNHSRSPTLASFSEIKSSAAPWHTRKSCSAWDGHRPKPRNCLPHRAAPWPSWSRLSTIGGSSSTSFRPTALLSRRIGNCGSGPVECADRYGFLAPNRA